MSPRLRGAEGTLVPLFPRGRSVRGIAWLIIAAGLLPASIAAIDDRSGLRLVAGAVSVSLLAIGLAVQVLLSTVEPGVVRVDIRAGALRFAPSRAVARSVSATAFALILPAIAQSVVLVHRLPTMTGSRRLLWAPFTLGLVGLSVLAVQLWRLRTPAGLALTTEGLRGIRGVSRVDWRWEDLAFIDVVAAPTAKISLVPRGGSGRPVSAPMLAFGSDPNQVAIIVQYYLDNPRERSALSEGGVAGVRRVEDAMRDRRT